MQRSKQRKLVDTVHPNTPEKFLTITLNNVTNGKTRQKLESRIRRRDGAR